MKVYLSVPIVANRNAERAKAMGRAIVDAGHEITSPWVLEPFQGPAGSAPDVFGRDKRGVETSDVVVADVSSPSIGVGMEVMAAHILGKRIVVVIARGSVVSRMLTQMEPKETIEFDGNEDLYRELRLALGSPDRP